MLVSPNLTLCRLGEKAPHTIVPAAVLSRLDGYLLMLRIPDHLDYPSGPINFSGCLQDYLKIGGSFRLYTKCEKISPLEPAMHGHGRHMFSRGTPDARHRLPPGLSAVLESHDSWNLTIPVLIESIALPPRFMLRH